jgi:hypothetical protein
MKLVLLPGMDGTGELFAPVVSQLSDIECLVVPLPQSGAQDYKSLENYFRRKLPEEDFF